MYDQANPATLYTDKADPKLYADVIIPLALPKNYTWAIPLHLQESVVQGSRVEVQLKNKKYSGIVKLVHGDKPGSFEPREILNLLDEQPLIYRHQLKFWEWVADYYMC